MNITIMIIKSFFSFSTCELHNISVLIINNVYLLLHVDAMFVMSRFCSMHVTVTLVRLMNIVCRIEDFIELRINHFPC